MKRISLKAALAGGVQDTIIRGPNGFVSYVTGYDEGSMPLERAHRILARVIEYQKDPDYVSISWASQVEASHYCESLSTALAEILKRDPTALDET